MNNEYQDITQHEIEALKFEYNLADAHTHQSQSPSQKKIVESLPNLWFDSEKKKQAELEKEFIKVFFEAQRQTEALKTPTMLVYAASIAMVIIANYLMKKKMSVALIDPVLITSTTFCNTWKFRWNPLKKNGCMIQNLSMKI